MDSKIIFFSIALLFSSAAAINITTVLDQYPQFSTFNSYLSQTHLAEEINARQPPFTILVVDNSNIAPLSGMPPDVLRKVMSVHVILDYFDAQKLQNLQGKSTLATTLFQTSGHAVGQQGFLNVTDLSNRVVGFASGDKGDALWSNMVKPVETRPYDLSVLQISNVINPFGIVKPSNSATSPSSSPVSTSSPAKSPVSSQAKSPVSSGPAKSPVSSGPAKSPVSPVSSSPAKSPVSSSPAKSPVSSPAKSPVSSPANAPASSQAKAPSVSPANAPIASPSNAPIASPTNVPAASPSSAPGASPISSPAWSPITSPASSPRKMLSPISSPSLSPSGIDTPTAAPESSPGTPSSTSSTTESSDSSVGTALGVSAGIIAATLSSNLFLMLMA